jgi:hypothetical protein
MNFKPQTAKSKTRSKPKIPNPQIEYSETISESGSWDLFSSLKFGF